MEISNSEESRLKRIAELHARAVASLPTTTYRCDAYPFCIECPAYEKCEDRLALESVNNP